MKKITDPQHSIELPRVAPFYMMQFQGTCQIVRGMFFTRVSMTWFTEMHHRTEWVETPNFENAFIPLEMNAWGRAQAFGRRDTIPDGHYGQDYVEIKYCFYQPNTMFERLPQGVAGTEDWFSLIESSVGPDWDQPPRIELRGHGMEIQMMDDIGTYSVRWPIVENQLCPSG
jgi:hypothetical protein